MCKSQNSLRRGPLIADGVWPQRQRQAAVEKMHADKIVKAILKPEPNGSTPPERIGRQVLVSIDRMRMKSMHLTEKIILVTGSTTGIGEAIARRALQEGASVMLHGRDVERGQAIAAELGGRSAFTFGDLADADVPRRVVEETVRVFGKLDAVVNNAAWVVRSDVDSTDAELFDRVMAVNVRAPFLMIKAALPYLKNAHGCVLNIGSINAYTGESNLLAYSVSKGALMTLSRNLADALCYDGVRVTHFNVGWVLTPNEYQYKLNDGLPADWPSTVPGQYAPSGRLMKPEEIAAAAVYWLSDASRPISGSVIDLEQYPFVGRNPTKRGE